jgi:hypothetical protein
MIKNTRVEWASEAMSQGCVGAVAQHEGRVSWVIPRAMGAVVSIPAAVWQQHEAVPWQGMTEAATACPLKVKTSRAITSHELRDRILTMKCRP